MSDTVHDAVPMPGHSQEARNKAVRQVLSGLSDLKANVFFEKSLTSSDASGSGRVVIPKAIAEQYFPRLEHQNGIPVHAVDTRGRDYTFKYRFWVNNQVSRMYLMEGAGALHRAFEMNVGDVMVFAQKPDGSLVVAGRPATKADVVKKPPVKRGAGGDGGGSARAGGGGGGSRGRDGARGPKRTGGSGAAGRGGDRDGKLGKRSKPGFGSAAAPSMADMEPAVDGIFRAVSAGPVSAQQQPGGVSASKGGRWVVNLNLAGELYQAYFDTMEDANEAYNAAGATPSVPA
ncbi:hypothetical protein FOA52_002958 [Chlamydomonas sp. UWO 241]|nr:hypothetical protein FOA52_002958 [Chlamydomonas sp. UWO 241]